MNRGALRNPWEEKYRMKMRAAERKLTTNTMHLRREELMQLLLAYVPLDECARRLKVTKGTVQEYLRDPEFKEKLALLQKEALKPLAEQMKEVARIAVEKLRGLLESPHDGIVLKACDSILDRVEETARNKHIQGELHGRYSIDPVTLMHAAAVSKEIMQDRSLSHQETLPAPKDEDIQ